MKNKRFLNIIPVVLSIALPLLYWIPWFRYETFDGVVFYENIYILDIAFSGLGAFLILSSLALFVVCLILSLYLLISRKDNERLQKQARIFYIITIVIYLTNFILAVIADPKVK